MEANLQLPRTALKLGEYVRYYTGEIINGRRMLRAYLVASFIVAEGPSAADKPGAYIEQPPMEVSDGGCAVVTVEYDVEAAKVASLSCNGLA